MVNVYAAAWVINSKTDDDELISDCKRLRGTVLDRFSPPATRCESRRFRNNRPSSICIRNSCCIRRAVPFLFHSFIAIIFDEPAVDLCAAEISARNAHKVFYDALPPRQKKNPRGVVYKKYARAGETSSSYFYTLKAKNVSSNEISKKCITSRAGCSACRCAE